MRIDAFFHDNLLQPGVLIDAVQEEMSPSLLNTTIILWLRTIKLTSRSTPSPCQTKLLCRATMQNTSFNKRRYFRINNINAFRTIKERSSQYGIIRNLLHPSSVLYAMHATEILIISIMSIFAGYRQEILKKARKDESGRCRR